MIDNNCTYRLVLISCDFERFFSDFRYLSPSPTKDENSTICRFFSYVHSPTVEYLNVLCYFRPITFEIEFLFGFPVE